MASVKAAIALPWSRVSKGELPLLTAPVARLCSSPVDRDTAREGRVLRERNICEFSMRGQLVSGLPHAVRAGIAAPTVALLPACQAAPVMRINVFGIKRIAPLDSYRFPQMGCSRRRRDRRPPVTSKPTYANGASATRGNLHPSRRQMDSAPWSRPVCRGAFAVVGLQRVSRGLPID